MKTLFLLLIYALLVPSVKKTELQKKPIRPTMEQRVQLTESKLKLINSEIKTEIATFE